MDNRHRIIPNTRPVLRMLLCRFNRNSHSLASTRNHRQICVFVTFIGPL